MFQKFAPTKNLLPGGGLTSAVPLPPEWGRPPESAPPERDDPPERADDPPLEATPSPPDAPDAPLAPPLPSWLLFASLPHAIVKADAAKAAEQARSEANPVERKGF